MDDEAKGRILGHILLFAIRFACGGAIGFGVAVLIVRCKLVIYWDSAWFNPCFLGACVIVCGVLAALFGDRFFEWVRERLFEA